MYSRRKFLSRSLAAAAALLVAFRARLAQAKTLALSLEKVPKLQEVGGSAILKLDEKQILFVRDGEDSVKALDAVCTHAGCLVSYDQEKGNIACSCHQSAFQLDGKQIAGPAPAPLPSYAARISEGRILVTVE